MCSPRREFRPARDAPYHGIPDCLPTPVPAPLRRTNNEDDDAQCILAQYTYTPISAPFLEICTSVLRLDVPVAFSLAGHKIGYKYSLFPERFTNHHEWTSVVKWKRCHSHRQSKKAIKKKGQDGGQKLCGCRCVSQTVQIRKC